MDKTNETATRFPRRSPRRARVLVGAIAATLAASATAGTQTFADTLSPGTVGARLVVNSPHSLTSGDIVLRDLLVTDGFSVELVADSDPSTLTTDTSLVILAPSATPLQVGSKYKTSGVPVVTLDVPLWDDMSLAGTAGGTTQLTSVQVVNASSPVVTGLPGNFDISSEVGEIRSVATGNLAPGAVRAVARGDTSNNNMVFTVAAGMQLTDGTSAPAARAAVGYSDVSLRSMTTEGQQVLQNVITWTQGNASIVPANPYDTSTETSPTECAKAASQRTGNWFCPQAPTPAESQAMTQRAQDQYGKDAVSDQEVTGAASGYCDPGGCWNIVDNYRTSYTGGGTYGYTSSNGTQTVLGQVSIYFKVTAAGQKLTVFPAYFKSTRGTTRNESVVESLYTSAAYPQGNGESPRHLSVASRQGILPANTYWDRPSPGPAWYEGVQSPTVFFGNWWKDPSSIYPGTWNYYVKSYKFTRASNGQYYTTGYLPQAARSSGWRP